MCRRSGCSDGLAKSKTHWQVLGNQVMLAPFDSDARAAAARVSMDKWSGYPAARDRLLTSIAEPRTESHRGDHGRHSLELGERTARELRSPRPPVVAAEFVGTSITSGGDGFDRVGGVSTATMSENPHMKWQNSRRGYVTCSVDGDAWNTEYKTVAYVSKPGAAIETPTKWRVEHGRAGITPA